MLARVISMNRVNERDSVQTSTIFCSHQAANLISPKSPKKGEIWDIRDLFFFFSRQEGSQARDEKVEKKEEKEKEILTIRAYLAPNGH